MRIQSRVDWNDRSVLHPWQSLEQPISYSGNRVDSIRGVDGAVEPSSTEDSVILRVGLAAKQHIRAAAWTALGSLPLPKDHRLMFYLSAQHGQLGQLHMLMSLKGRFLILPLP